MNGNAHTALNVRLARFDEVLFAFLFGSRAGGKPRPDSDWDIGVCVSDALTAEQRFDLRRRLFFTIFPTQKLFARDRVKRINQYVIQVDRQALRQFGAQAVGSAEACYEASVKYAQEREAFGGPIVQFQGIQWKIADMKCRLEAARLLTYQASLAKEAAQQSGARFTSEASIAKLYASETAMFCANQAVQIHAAMGYSKELPVERFFRDAKITEIYEGTSEIQRLVISRMETGLR